MKLQKTLTALLAVLSGTLGYWIASLQASQEAGETDENMLSLQAEVRCAEYWLHRSGIADAQYQFTKGRRSLLEVVGAEDPSIDYEVPGVKKGVSVETTRTTFLTGPLLENLGVMHKHRSPGSLCRDNRTLYYAYEYNVEMMRLLGRSDETFRLTVSPEISALDPRTAD
jgi:hypothetical protein